MIAAKKPVWIPGVTPAAPVCRECRDSGFVFAPEPYEPCTMCDGEGELEREPGEYTPCEYCQEPVLEMVACGCTGGPTLFTVKLADCRNCNGSGRRHGQSCGVCGGAELVPAFHKRLAS